MRFLACLSVAMTVLASTASAQVASSRYHLRDDSFGTVEGGANRVAANGRCSGISFGTGARRCDSPSGGPSGGISSRN